MKQLLLSLLLLCSLGISAQDGVVTRPKKQQTTTTAPKQNSSQKPAAKKPSATTSKPSSQHKPTVQSPTIGTSTYTPDVMTFTANGVSFQMVEVRGGTFRMGATSEQGSDAYDDEKPVHQVTLSSYYIGKYEVTQDLWQAVMGNNPSYFKGSRKPVERVRWGDCQTFISKLNSLTGNRFRLPTEAEWEFASRGGTMSRGYKYSGSNTLSNVAWYRNNSNSTTHDVGMKSPNELGLYDMTGNVFEWCSDWYDSYSSNSQTNPTGASGGYRRVNRGGSWSGGYDYAKLCHSSSRGCYTPFESSDIGLRLVLVP
ncbi:MAG: SUMF1/EgtB/PvdO family nonheme iron enzyme [Bacteroidales bacterium]|nr:SUMF1/EgtB/PvdO family nonheme iron enzyme [Candidatus Sodaliphilus limicaballi]